MISQLVRGFHENYNDFMISPRMSRKLLWVQENYNDFTKISMISRLVQGFHENYEDFMIIKKKYQMIKQIT